jgi:hypothetical protein
MLSRHQYAPILGDRDRDQIADRLYTLENQSSFRGPAKNDKGILYQWKIYVESN